MAPTNAAFAKLGDDVLGYLQGNTEVLTNVLLYHVLPGEVFSDQITNGLTATTVLGADVKFSFHWYWSRAHHWWRHGLFVNKDALVAIPDVDASNGVIHVIDEVLIPPIGFGGDDSGRLADTDIVEAAVATDDLSTLVAAVTAAGLVETLQGPGPFTVFAPINSAFEALGQDALDALLADPAGDLTNILTFHVIDKEISSADFILSGAHGVVMLNGDVVGLDFDGAALTLSDSTDEVVNIVAADIFVENGVVHLIDKVLIPPEGCPYHNRIWCWFYGY